MKVRKLAVALALAGGLGSGVAHALGLGEIELQSYLNEPLDAEIILPQSRGVDPGDVFVNIASETAYERVGLSRNQFLSKLRFQVVTQNDGSLAVNVSSREPLREPYLNFLLELTWPSGRLMREYAVLVDPPVYAEESGVQESVSVPSASSRREVASQPSPTRSAESVRRQRQAEQTLGRGYQADTFGPTGPSDTLWTIASRMRPDSSVSMQQVMLAIQDLNPDAFIAGNINRLKRGEVLRVPSLDQIQSRTRAEATRVVGQQNREFQSPQRTVDATVSTPQQAAPDQAPASGDELKLLVAENDSRETTEGGSAGGDSQLPGGVDAGAAVAMEELESARRENDELNSRVEDLQDQVETLQRLLELKNTQLSDLQTMAGESGSDSAPVDSQVATAPAGGESQPPATDDVADASQAGEGMAETAATESGLAEDSVEQPAESASEDAGQAEADGTLAADDMAVTENGSTDETGMVEAEPEVAETAPAAAPEEPAVEAEPKPEPEPVSQAPAQDKGFPGNIIDAITGNPMYQIALGGGLILLLLLLLLLARRNANREKAFYEQLNSEADDSADSFDLSLDDEESEHTASEDALAEADTYIAYGRYDQAAQALETATSREPSRVDLRLKLLGVYADTQDRESFEKQFTEIEALDDEDALASASELRSRLEEAESMPSIDDLESQLRSDSFGTDYSEQEGSGLNESEEEAQVSDELLADQYDSEKEADVENEFGDFDSDLTDFDLTEIESSEASALDEGKQKDEENSEDGLIEYDLSGLSTDSESEEAASTERSEPGLEENEDTFDFKMDLGESEESDELSDDIDLDLDSSLESEPEPAVTESASSDDDLNLDLSEDEVDAESMPGSEENDSEGDIDSLDESFLDELDAELDKVASEEEELGGTEIEESSLDDLELDVSDEDLALMEEFSDSADSSNHEEDEASALDEELGLEDTLGEGDVLGESEAAGPEEEVSGAEELEDLDALGDMAEQDESADDVELPIASEEVADETEKRSAPAIDESDLGDDDDFDFLAGTDEAATKLDLARAYMEMGDSDGARDILEEVALEGDEDQKAEAQDLLKNLS
ncbi:hypothetical protein BKP64_04990 [Marinobacter salinus]|uniref:FimV N-terminal domain-containing protein n=1 Tax=Marinobacter salinus TaxID=1874317 RepID=A0A1D9GIW1_9GAMM|nr:FimV/HubP family polar landmark protein [Marinobacter salinus]AOY87577.1 hypothetical protein BKP64_04990 [Marinobacter salinus]